MGNKFFLFLLLCIVAAQALWLFPDLGFAEKLGIEAIVLAIAAFLFAVEHSHKLHSVASEIRGVTGKLESVANELGGVARSVPTRGIGVFPDYLDEVVKLVDRAENNLTILCDTPAHGCFSNTPAFIDYWSALRHKMVDGNVEINCAFFDSDGRKQLHRAQIADVAEDWDAWKERNRQNCEAFDAFARKRHLTPPVEADAPEDAWAVNPDAYVESMMIVNKYVLSEFGNGFEPGELEFAHPLREGPNVYFWRRDDDQEAVFVIVPVPGIGVRDLAGFHTREPELIRALSTVYEHRNDGR